MSIFSLKENLLYEPACFGNLPQQEEPHNKFSFYKELFPNLSRILFYGEKMKRYIFREIEIIDEYRYIFVCGTKYRRNSVEDKRNVLRNFIKTYNSSYKPIILEDNFIFKKSNSRLLVYDDIYMKDLYQVEMLTNYLADKNIIIHESISTGAETGLFLSEKQMAKKTCLLVPDQVAVEEDKIGQFIKLAFLNETSDVEMITYYPRVEKNIISNEVTNWHTYFYKNKIGKSLGKNIIKFLKVDGLNYQIRFVRDIDKVSEGMIHYSVKDGRLEIKALPRIIMLCIATIFNVDEFEGEIFSAGYKQMKEYIEIVKKCLQQVFINTIEEKTGKEIYSCTITPSMNVGGVYISGVIGMCLYLFQAAEFIQIVKADDYKESSNVEITRKIVECKNGMNHFFYKKYDECIGCAVDTQIV